MSYGDFPNYSNLPPGCTDRDIEEAAGSFDEEDEGRSPIPCSKCGELTTWDPIYNDLCCRCCRADNE